jgi:hypothetical protein
LHNWFFAPPPRFLSDLALLSKLMLVAIHQLQSMMRFIKIFSSASEQRETLVRMAVIIIICCCSAARTAEGGSAIGRNSKKLLSTEARCIKNVKLLLMLIGHETYQKIVYVHIVL